MTDDPPAHPTAIGGFPVIRILGEGGMGAVYECKDESLDRLVAVKVLRADLAADTTHGARFLREARTLARVSSPHVVAIHALGEHEKRPFIVMERLAGEDLGQVIAKKGTLPVDEVVTIARDSIAGLRAAAEAGVVHRDVKPSNLFLVNGRVKVTDFGLAIPVDGSASLTSAGLVVGTPHYMAPELGRGAAASVASDVYALGATLLELLIGRPVFGGKTPLDALAAHIIEPVPDVKKLVPSAAHLAPMLEKMLQKKAEARFQTWEDVETALQNALSAPPPPTVVVTPNVPVAATSGADMPSTSGAGVRSETLTVMFTDIAGYTERTGRQSREEAARWLALHDALLKPIIRAFRGSIIKSIGDALLVTFRSPTDAVLCGCAIQDRLFAHNATAAESDRIEVRVALSAGEVRVQRGDIFGEPVNLAARLEGLAKRGEVMLTDAVYSTMNAAEVALESRGTHSFKGIPREVHVYAAVPSGGAGEAPFKNVALSRVRATPSTNVAAAADAIVNVTSNAMSDVMAKARSIPRNAALAIAAASAVIILVIVFATGDSLDEAERNAVAALDVENARDAKKVLTASKDDDVDDVMADLAVNGTWWQRHNARDVLEARGKADRVDGQAFAIRDLTEGEGCGRKRMGLLLLKRTARDESALTAIEEAKKGALPDTLCMAFDWDHVTNAIKKQLEKK